MSGKLPTNSDVANDARAVEGGFRALVESAHQGMLVLDRSGAVTFANRRMGELLEYQPQEMLGRSAFDFIDPSSHQDAAACLAKRWHGVSEDHDLKLLRKSGSTLWCNIAGSPLHEDGVIVGALAVATDLTPNKSVESRLRRLTAWHALSSRVSETILRVREPSELLQAVCRIAVESGPARFAWVGALNTEMSHLTALARFGDDAGIIDNALANWDKRGPVSQAIDTMLGGEPLFIDASSEWLAPMRLVDRGCAMAYPLRLPNVHIGFLAVFALAAEFDAEESAILEAVANNVSFAIESALQDKERQRAEFRRRAAETQLAAQAELLDKAKDAIVVTDLEGIVKYWNRGAENLYGWRREEAVDRNVLDLLYRDQAQLRSALKSLLASGEWSGELVQVTQAGEQRFVDASWTLVRDGRGSPRSVFSINTDITAKKELQAQFLRAQRLESVGTLAGGIAHDFNNIIAAIRGNAHLALADLPSDHPARASLAGIEKAGARAADLVQQIMTFSRRQESVRKVIALSSVVEEALQFLRAALPADIEIRSHFAPAANVSADAIQLHQIVMNLGTNAAHAMPNGGVLSVGVEGVVLDAEQAAKSGLPQAGRYTLLSVQDTGEGMDPAIVARAFEPFFTTKPPGQGSGLGLSVVHGIVQNHGGAIAVHTARGRGCLVQVYFPAVDTDAHADAPRSIAVAKPSVKRILYVDDEDDLVILVSRTLQRLGYHVTGHTDPKRALEELRRDATRFDAVVTDLAMPGFSGTELARELLRAYPGLPVVILTGHVRPEDELLIGELGVRAVLQKALSFEDLGRALQDVLGH